MGRRSNEQAPYYIQLRDAERRIIASALLATNWNFPEAAEALGIGARYLQARTIQLGGILPNTTSNEPPPAIWAKRPKPSKEPA